MLRSDAHGGNFLMAANLLSQGTGTDLGSTRRAAVQRFLGPRGERARQGLGWMDGMGAGPTAEVSTVGDSGRVGRRPF